MNVKSFKLSVMVILLIGLQPVSAQKTYNADAEKSKVIIEGTSNVHDWEMNAENPKSRLELTSESEKDVASVSFEVPVKSMKSGKGRMDKNTYEALKEEDHDKIIFKSTEIENENGKYFVAGDLNIAGVSKKVRIPFKLSKNENTLNLTLAYEINMLDYKVEPPTALFGTIKTGEKVNVKINLIYQ
jgi:polyisoprenoid-binding protein YceI